MKFVEERSQTADKPLLVHLDTFEHHKYDGHDGDLVAKLRTLDMNVDEYFLVQFILESLAPKKYRPLQINDNTIKDNWNEIELTSNLVQEETR